MIGLGAFFVSICAAIGGASEKFAQSTLFLTLLGLNSVNNVNNNKALPTVDNVKNFFEH